MTLRNAGIAMTIGGLLFFTRMAPVMMVIPDDMDFPPSGPADLARLTELAGTGWQISHIMGLIAVGLFTYGYWAHARVLKQAGAPKIGTLSAIVATVSFGAFAIALIIDGFGVPAAAKTYGLAAESLREAVLANMSQMHDRALWFFTPAIFLMFIAIGLLSSRLIHRFIHYRWLGFSGMLLAIAGPTTYLFGIAGPHWDNMRVGGSLMMLAFLWHLLIGLAAWFGRGVKSASLKPSRK